MNFVCYSRWDQLPDGADALFEQSAKRNLFYSRPWLESLTATAMDDGQSLALACVESEDRVMAILPLISAEGGTWTALSHRYTPHFSLLLADADQSRVLACLAQGLAQLPMRGLLLEPVADDDDGLKGLQVALEALGFGCEYLFRHYNWILRVEGRSYPDYLASRPARLRNTLARKRRKLEREQGYDIRLYQGEEVAAAMDDYHAVYTASWKANEQYRPLLDRMVAAFSRQGWSRLGILYVQGRPVAAQLWFVCHGKASIFRLSYDEAWKGYSPGSILTDFLMRHVIDSDMVEEVDFLTGNDAYKQDWMSDRRTRFALSCIMRKQPVGRARGLLQTLKRMLHIR